VKKCLAGRNISRGAEIVAHGLRRCRDDRRQQTEHENERGENQKQRPEAGASKYISQNIPLSSNNLIEDYPT
jgi:hypothetical protein